MFATGANGACSNAERCPDKRLQALVRAKSLCFASVEGEPSVDLNLLDSICRYGHEFGHSTIRGIPCNLHAQVIYV
jgi:hypothetical protein